MSQSCRAQSGAGKREHRRILQDIMPAWHWRLEGAERAELHSGAIGVHGLRPIGELRIADGVPLDFSAAVGSFAPHDGGEGAIGDLTGFVQRFVVENSLDEVAMFIDIAVVELVRGRAPGFAVFGFDPIASIMEFRDAGGASCGFADRAPGAFDLAAISVQARAIGILVLDSDVVPDFAGLAVELLSSAHTPAFNRVSFHDPIGDIKIVNVLFTYVIAAEPNVMVPIAELRLHFGGALLTAMPDGSAIDPIGPQGDDVSDGAVVKAVDCFDIAGAMAALSAGGDFEIFLFGFFGCGIHGANARTIDAYGFFHEDIFADFNAGFEMRRGETWRCREDGIVHTRLGESLLVSIKAAEAF